MEEKKLKPSDISKLLAQLNDKDDSKSDPFDLIKVEAKGRGPKGIS